jgi:N-ATPase, AtpR subunit
MSAVAFASLAPVALAAVFAGTTFGLLYFMALRRTSVLLAGNGGCKGAFAFTLARIGGVVLLLGLAARLGAVPLLATFIGFLAARAIALRAFRRGS